MLTTGMKRKHCSCFLSNKFKYSAFQLNSICKSPVPFWRCVFFLSIAFLTSNNCLRRSMSLAESTDFFLAFFVVVPSLITFFLGVGAELGGLIEFDGFNELSFNDSKCQLFFLNFSISSNNESTSAI